MLRRIAHAERGRAQHRVDRIARDEMEDREDEQRRQQQYRDRLDQAREDELRHLSLLRRVAAASSPLDLLGRMDVRKVRYTSPSYRILSPPAMKNGSPKAAAES